MILVRHGQSHFNVHFGATREDPGIVDPTITDLGAQQIQTAAEQLRGREIKAIIASPYTRTLESAQIIAKELGLPVSIEPQVRERAFFTCDIGTPASELRQSWPKFDFRDLEEIWWPEVETDIELSARCHAYRDQRLGADDWKNLLIVTHWGFIRGLTGQEVQNATIVDYDPVRQEPPPPMGF